MEQEVRTRKIITKGSRFEPTTRECSVCESTIMRVYSAENILVYDSYYYCHRDACQQAKRKRWREYDVDHGVGQPRLSYR